MVPNQTLYQSDSDGHPYFGPVVGRYSVLSITLFIEKRSEVISRYANRIRNGTFTIPPSKDASGPNKFHVAENENNGTITYKLGSCVSVTYPTALDTDTLHGGVDGFDRRIWTVAKHTKSSVAFTLVDPDGMQGFPGTVHATVSGRLGKTLNLKAVLNLCLQVTYTLGPKSTWKITMHAAADEETPIMLSGHHYWNFEAFQETQDLIGHHAQFGASKVIATNGLLIPNGSLIDVTGTPLDFRQAKSIGGSINATASAEYCGTGTVEWQYFELDR